MSARTLRPLFHHPGRALLRPPPSALDSSLRTFFTSPSSAPQTLTAERTLHYPTLDIYSIIADIPAYPTFVPLCRSAKVTSWSRPDAHHNRRWPQRATLEIGYGGSIKETFASRVFCVPPVKGEMGRAGVGYVEAVSGRGVVEEVKSRLEGDGGEDLKHHDVEAGKEAEVDVDGGPLQMLRTRWTVKGYPFVPPNGESPAKEGHERTDVTLSIEFRFGNLAYDMMSRAAAPMLAEKMIEAFERRVKGLLDK